MPGVLLSQGHKPKALTLEHAGFARSIDGLLAQQVASLAGIDLDYRTTRPNFYRSGAALDVFYVADGMTPSFGLFISQVYPELAPRKHEPGLGRIGRWACGWVDTRRYGATLRSNLPHFSGFTSRPTGVFCSVFCSGIGSRRSRPAARRIKQAMAGSLIARTAGSSFQMANRNRRRVGMPPHHQYSRKVIALTPGLDSELIEFT